MIEFSSAQDLVTQLASELGAAWPAQRVGLADAVGRVLSEDVRAEAPVPLADYSAMDGYAVRTADFSPDATTELPVCAEVFAGGAPEPLALGSVARIFTGATLPSGADSVVMQENVERRGDRIFTTHRPRPGDHVRRSGEDLKVGAVGLQRGERITPFRVGLLATLERSEVTVAARPRVGILCTGDELRPPGRPFATGLAESNGVALEALLSSVGATVERLPLVADTLTATEAALRQAAGRCDVILTVGGVSVGDRDFVRPALEVLGAETLFSKVKIKPGKPVSLMRVGRLAVLALPGNPASALVTCALFGAPLVRRLQGDSQAALRWRKARLAAPLEQKPGRLNFYRAKLHADEVAPLTNQASGASTAMAWANSLLMVSADAERVESGALVDVLPYVEL